MRQTETPRVLASDPPPDRRQEADALRLAITRTARRLRQEAGGGLSPTLIATLASIERHKVLTPGELARIEGVQRPTITRAISRLAEDGLIERNQDPDDRRSSLISVSSRGHDYLVGHRSRKNAWLANLIEEMPSEDADTLARAAGILTRALETHRTGEHGLPGPPADGPDEAGDTGGDVHLDAGLASRTSGEAVPSEDQAPSGLEEN